MPRLPCKRKTDVSKCQACHAKRRWISPSATPATQTGSQGDQQLPTAPPDPAQPRPLSAQVPRLPRKTKVDVSKCHACHAKGRWMSPKCHPCHAKRRCACPGARGDQQLPSAPPKPAQFPNCHACHAKADIAKCHTCHVKRRVASINQDLQKPIPSQSTCGTWYTWYTGRRVDKLKNAFSKKKRAEAKKSGGRVQNGRFFPPFGRLFPPFGRVGGKILGNQTKKRVFLKKRY